MQLREREERAEIKARERIRGTNVALVKSRGKGRDDVKPAKNNTHTFVARFVINVNSKW